MMYNMFSPTDQCIQSLRIPIATNGYYFGPALFSPIAVQSVIIVCWWM